MSGKIIPFGYAVPNAQQTLDALMEEKRAILVDIRHAPHSQRRPEWNADALMERYGGLRYRLCGKYLGNINYNQTGKPIQLANPQHRCGIPFLLDGLRKGYTLILLCACASLEQCHRKVVCDLVREAMPEVEIVREDEKCQYREDIIVTVPKDFGLDTWIDEGDPAGAEWSGEEWHFYLYGTPPVLKPGARIYVTYNGVLRGYAHLVRIDRFEGGRYGLVRHGGAVAVTIPEYIPGFRGFRYRWWSRDLEVPFPDWQNPDAMPPGRPQEIVPPPLAAQAKLKVDLSHYWTSGADKVALREEIKPRSWKKGRRGT